MKQKIYLSIFWLTVSIFILPELLAISSQEEQNQKKSYYQKIKPHTNHTSLISPPQWLFSNSPQISAKPFLPPVAERDPIEILINGETQTSVTEGEPLEITVYFSATETSAELSIWADMDGDGVWDPETDLPLPETSMTIIDNDLYDDNPADGIYQFTIDDDEGPWAVANFSMFFVAQDAGGLATAFIFINPNVTAYSVSGSINPTAENIIILAMGNDEMKLSTSNAAGDYQIFLNQPAAYTFMAFDAIGVLGGLLSSTVYEDVWVDSHLSDYDFDFVEGDAELEGTVSDDEGAPMAGYTIVAEFGGPAALFTETDENGFYSFSITAGEWYLNFIEQELLPDYMLPPEEEFYIESGATMTVDITIFAANADVTGNVYLDDQPVAGLEIYAWNDITGEAYTFSAADGSYTLPLSSAGNSAGGYDLWVNIWDILGAYTEDWYSEVVTGSSSLDFYIYTASGGINGYIYDSESSDPLDNAWISAYDGENHFGAGVDDSGYYELSLPAASYQIRAGSELYYEHQIDDVTVGDNFTNYDFYLDPIIFSGALQGFIFDAESDLPLENVELYISNDIFWQNTTSDSDGFYHFDLPNGNFNLNLQHPLYFGAYYDNIYIANETVTMNFDLNPIVMDGALEGYVFDSETEAAIAEANIEISGYYSTTVQSDENGFFSVNLPNGGYSAVCWKDAYTSDTLDWFEISNYTIVNNFYLTSSNEADDLLNSKTALFNHPNPFRPTQAGRASTTTISFTLASAAATQLTIYNSRGQIVHQLLEEDLSAGQHSIAWDGKNQHGKFVGAGIYFYRLESGASQLTRKMLLLK
ncbi:MAG: FlgD immunoglobulin-like domain containing protein [Candidatus Cloacimonadales bacterium]